METGAFMKDKLMRSMRRIVAGGCLLALALTPSAVFSQQPIPVPDTGQPIPVPDAGQAAPAPVLSANELDGLVAPIALYPDPVISQILVASTYPLEVVEAYQWLQRNPGLTGQALTQAAAQQNWDPSVQALVVFPDVLQRLNQDVSWTTNLGNAFLNQQGDVMAAVQRMRLSAEQSGKLVSTPQQQVIMTSDAGQPVVEIEPVNPEVIYVPTYDPAWIWGPAVYYPYPRWYYPHSGFYFGVGIGVGAFFGGGWGGWGGWGWHPAWGHRTVIVNNTFIQRNNFNSVRMANMPRTAVWSHDAFHRQGVPYSNRAVAERFRPNMQVAGGRAFASSTRPAPMSAPSANFASRQQQTFANRSFSNSYAGRPAMQNVPSRNSFSAAPVRTPGNFRQDRSFNAPAARSYSAPVARSYSEP